MKFDSSKTYYTFDDVVILPRFNRVRSRQLVDLSTKIGNLMLKVPIISANMKSVTGPEMCKSMWDVGGLGVLHRFGSIDENVRDFKNVKQSGRKCGVSIGVGDDEIDRLCALYELGAEIIVIDVAHGAQLCVAEQARKARQIVGNNAALVVGNFANASSVRDFLTEFSGIDCIKVGVGPGAACSTRLVTGAGCPQLSAIMECAELVNSGYLGSRYGVIADGGIRTSGDIGKALGAGSSAVMLGRLLASTTESLGNGAYYGSASERAYNESDKTATWRAAEGVAYSVPIEGSVESVVTKLCAGLRSALTYTGSQNLQEFRDNVVFAKQTHAGYFEGTPHGERN